MMKKLDSAGTERTAEAVREGEGQGHAPRDLDARFQEAVENGEIDGDVVLVDEAGREIKPAAQRKTIFDL